MIALKLATGSMMRELDKYCIETLGIPGIVLMENAALKVLKNINLKICDSFTIVCGKGNNGGDGFAIARHLHVSGKKVEVFSIGTKEDMSEDCRTNYSILKNLGININKIDNLEDISQLRDATGRSQMTIDALFGTGLGKNVEGIYDMVISIINENSSNILAIDVPSGFNSDTGKIMGNCVRAHKTITFQLYKKGFLTYGSDKYAGEIIVEDIGIPREIINKLHNSEFIIDREMVRSKIQVRDKYAHKGDYGRVLIAAGSKGFTGAAYIASQGAVRSGSGLVTLCCGEDIQSILSSKLTEAMTLSFKEKERLREVLEKCDAVAIGPGMGSNKETLEALKYVLQHAKCPIVIDADGINILKDQLPLIRNSENKIILTPHPGEMARITGLSIDYINHNRIEVAAKFAKDYGAIVLLKGYNTVITDGEVTMINPAGNSSMASGGMGDCLTGIITSFIGQGYKPLEAASLAAYVHGYAGDKLSKEMFCVNASHVVESLPYVIKELQTSMKNEELI
jgi:ADP-dependent NAD(P)H-hydrate dehydratase / NAD(P)H-hydrate epimerase